uniref:Uncharacterized protein n=1 Tax=Cacopsylla melanoneura TaxID=428564 RepID=A0A8D8SN54_9HEMI
MFLERQWSNPTVPSVWMCTHPNHHVTITQTVLTLAPGFHTCCSWFIRSIDQNGLLTSLYQDCTGSKFTPSPINCNRMPPPTSKPRFEQSATTRGNVKPPPPPSPPTNMYNYAPG